MRFTCHLQALDRRIYVVLQLVIEYGSGAVDDYIRVADAIEDRFPDLAVDGQELDVESGALTVTREDGTVLYKGDVDTASDTFIEELEKAGVE